MIRPQLTCAYAFCPAMALILQSIVDILFSLVEIFNRIRSRRRFLFVFCNRRFQLRPTFLENIVVLKQLLCTSVDRKFTYAGFDRMIDKLDTVEIVYF